MNFDGELRLLFKVRPLALMAFNEVKNVTELELSAVPGFNNNRRIILLRGPNYPAKDNTYFDTDTIPCYDKPSAKLYPQLMKLVNKVVEQAGFKEVGMVTVAIMQPGAKVAPHVDLGPYYSYYKRLHVPLNSVAGSTLTSGSTTVGMKAGEVWELNNLLTHSAENNGVNARYHVIIDGI